MTEADARPVAVTYAPAKAALPAYIAAIAAAEAYLTFFSVLGGAIAYAILLVVMVNHAAFRLAVTEKSFRRDATSDPMHAVLALTFVPLIRLVSMSVPLDGTRDPYQYLIVGGPLLAGIAWAAWGVGLPGAGFGLHSLPLQLAVAILGVPLAFAAYFVVVPNAAGGATSSRELAVSALSVTVAAVVDEVVFRGFIQEACASLYGASAPLWSTLVYAISYLGVRPLELVFVAVFLGLLFGWTVARTHSLLGVTISHVLVNVGLLVLLPSAPVPVA